MKSVVWMSYDLGVNGDYDGIYAWLDNHGAKECGSSVAFFDYEHEGDLLPALKRDIQAAVDLDKKARVYVIRRQDGYIKGRYLIGNRKGAPWEGYGDVADAEDDSD